MNKNYRKGYNFQRRVIKYLNSKGFSAVVQPKSAFPDIIAWNHIVDDNNNPFIFDITLRREGKEYLKKFVPFIIFAVECKVNKYLTKEEKEKAIEMLRKNKITAFLVAYRERKKLNFYEINIDKKIENKLKNEDFTRYIG